MGVGEGTKGATMTRQEIDEFMRTKNDREIDLLVTDRIMGWKQQRYGGYVYWGKDHDDIAHMGGFKPMTDINDAMAVLEKLESNDWGWSVYHSDPGMHGCDIWPIAKQIFIAEVRDKSVTRAICHAALLTKAED